MNGAVWGAAVGAFIVSFFLTVVFSRRLIPALRRRKAGQPILEIGPAWHMIKQGTPTMGGLAFIGAIAIGGCVAVLILIRSGKSWQPLALILLYAVLCALIGLADDRCKLSKQKNQGLTAPQKYLLQLLASALFLFLAMAFLGVDTTVKLPFSRTVIDLNGFYYPLALLYLTGMVNALNLTDGVDGLLSSTVAVLSVFLLAWGALGGGHVVGITGALLLGGALGFFCFNRHPAQVFMGDTGSLFFGGAVSAVGILVGHPLLLLLAGGVFVLEAASVVLQVVWFKLSRGRRLFRMAPFHHHLEKGGWSEWQVVILLVLIAAIFAVVAILGR